MHDSSGERKEVDAGVTLGDPGELLLALLRKPVEAFLPGGAVGGELLTFIGFEVGKGQLLRSLWLLIALVRATLKASSRAMVRVSSSFCRRCKARSRLSWRSLARASIAAERLLLTFGQLSTSACLAPSLAAAGRASRPRAASRLLPAQQLRAG